MSKTLKLKFSAGVREYQENDEQVKEEVKVPVYCSGNYIETSTLKAFVKCKTLEKSEWKET